MARQPWWSYLAPWFGTWRYDISEGRQYVWLGFWLRVPKRWHR